MLSFFRKNIFPILIFTIIVYFFLFIYFDWHLVIYSFQKFPVYLIPILLILSFFTLLTRFFKWIYYLKVLKIAIPFSFSAKVFFSSLSMGITPGKWGELIKSYLIHKKFRININLTAPIVLAERFTDISSLIIIATLGAYLFNYGIKLVLLIDVILLLVYFLIISNKTLNIIINKLSQIKLFESLKTAGEFINVNKKIMSPKHFLRMTFFSLSSWFFECFLFYIILSNFQKDISFNWTSFSYTLSTLIGSFSLLPGGIGATEGSLTYLLIQKGILESDAIVSVFILRLATLWFSVLIGVFSLAVYNSTEKLDFLKFLKDRGN